MEHLSIQDINLVEWHSERETTFLPNHFIRSKAPVTPESLDWIKNNLVGRYAIINETDFIKKIDRHSSRIAAFEDPREAVFFELTWA